MYSHQKTEKYDRWLVSVSYKDSNGKNCRKWATAHSLKEAKDLEDKLKKEVRAGIFSNKATLDSMAMELFSRKKEEIKRTSLDSYMLIYNVYIKPSLGNKGINDFSVKTCSDWKKSIDEELSLTRKKNIYVTLHMILRYAFKTYGYTAIYLLESVGNFKKDPNAVVEHKALQYWKPEQFNSFINKMREFCEKANPRSQEYMCRWSSYVLLSICFYAGLRRGEANALYVSDFHCGENPYLDITKSVTKKVKGGGWFLTGPKNPQSVRKVPIPRSLALLLEEHINCRLKKIEGYNEAFYLCGGQTPVNDSSTDRIKESIERKNGIPHITVHDLRHSYVSVLINSNVPITTISKLVGHSSPDITWKVYSHLYPETMTRVVDVFDELNKAK